MFVDSLGVYDNDGDGLSAAHEVDLWRVSDGFKLASVTVPAGTSGILDSDFRFVSITPVALTSGGVYRVSATYGLGDVDDKAYGDTQTPVSNVTLTSGTFFSYGSTALYPSEIDPDSRATANFTTTVSAVPEPSAVVTGLLCIGVAAFGVRRKYLARSK